MGLLAQLCHMVQNQHLCICVLNDVSTGSQKACRNMPVILTGPFIPVHHYACNGHVLNGHVQAR